MPGNNRTEVGQTQAGPSPDGRASPGTLRVENLTKRFAGLIAVNDVSLEVEKARITSIIGPNGAGKSTLFDLITGLLQPSAGRVFYGAADVTRWPPHSRVKAGLGRTFQNVQLFPNLNVLENVMAARYCRAKRTYAEALFFLPRDRRERRHDLHAADQALQWVGVYEKRLHLPRELPYGEQRRVEIARALATDPKTLMLDEPSAGMIDREAGEIMELLGRLCDEGKTILLIEHNMRVVMSISHRVVVLNFGEQIAEGTATEIQINDEVLEAYLGTDE